jgi:aminoglycoside phosphotransferase (APT) family kinase protein
VKSDKFRFLSSETAYDGMGELAEEYARAIQPGLAKLDSTTRRKAEDFLGELPPFKGAPTLVHGDLHSENILVNNGKVVALVDFARAAFADPLVDAAIAEVHLLRTGKEKDEFYSHLSAKRAGPVEWYKLAHCISHLCWSVDEGFDSVTRRSLEVISEVVG